MPGFHVRGFTSLLLSLAFLVVGLSGLLLWLAPPPASPVGGWLILGVSKGVWKSAHIYVGLAMIAATVVHLVLNWSLYWGYLWNQAAKRLNRIGEAMLAVVVIVGVAVVASVAGPGGRHGPGGPKGFGPKGPGGPADRVVAEETGAQGVEKGVQPAQPSRP